MFDSAPNYGDSEEIIGKFLSKYPKSGINVVTKLDLDIYDENIWKNKKVLSNKIREDFNLSCRKLGLSKIPIYLVHRSPYAIRNNGTVLDILTEIKNEGKIGSIGTSLNVGEEDELKEYMDDERVELVEIPFSIPDRRFSRSGLLEMSKKRGLTVFARSIYLQGLLLMNPEKIPKHLKKAVEFIESLHKIAQKSNRSIAELCVKYVLSVNGISSIVVGINSVEQIKENIKAFNSEPLEKEVIEAIDKIPIPPEYIINSGNWDKLNKTV